jgi:hypothetical protein
VFVVELALAWVGQKHQLELDPKYKLPHLHYKGDKPKAQRVRVDPKCLIHELDGASPSPHARRPSEVCGLSTRPAASSSPVLPSQPPREGRRARREHSSMATRARCSASGTGGPIDLASTAPLALPRPRVTSCSTPLTPRCSHPRLAEPEDEEPSFPLRLTPIPSTVPLPPQGLAQAAAATAATIASPLQLPSPFHALVLLPAPLR